MLEYDLQKKENGRKEGTRQWEKATKRGRKMGGILETNSYLLSQASPKTLHIGKREKQQWTRAEKRYFTSLKKWSTLRTSV